MSKTYLRCRNNLTTTTLTLRGTLDNTGQIQNLNLSTAILQDTGDSSQRGEAVRCSLTLGFRDLREESRLSDGWESDQGYTRISALAHVEAGATTGAGTGSGLEKLGS